MSKASFDLDGLSDSAQMKNLSEGDREILEQSLNKDYIKNVFVKYLEY